MVRLISEGLTTPQIAEQLNLGENTVHTYRQRIMNLTGTVWRLTKVPFRCYLVTQDERKGFTENG